MLRVESYRGDFDVYAFTGSEANWLLNPLTLSDSNAARLDANTQIPLDTGSAYTGCANYAHLPNDCVHTASNSCGTVDYAIRVDPVYAIPEIQKMIAATSSRTGREFDLQSQLPPGDNWLSLKVVPKALSPITHDWFLRIQLSFRYIRTKRSTFCAALTGPRRSTQGRSLGSPSSAWEVPSEGVEKQKAM